MVMVNYPECLLQQNPYIEAPNSKIIAVNLSSSKETGCVHLLQTSHCLEIVFAGKHTITVGGFSTTVNAQEIQFRTQGNYLSQKSNNYRSLLIFIDNEFILSLLNTVKSFPAFQISPHIPAFPMSDYDEVIAFEIISRINEPKKYSPCIIRHSVEQLLFQLLSKAGAESLASYLRAAVSINKSDLAFFMQANFTKRLSLIQMAQMTERSLSTFKKDFSDYFNTSPFRWLLNRRLEHARDLLHQTDQTISVIAYQSGFENPAHFSKSYRAKFHISPSEERISCKLTS